ncbi:MAG: nuclear transport factor 2 family protein [Burkholderiales bacterium]|nr:nuclear transport factor 2 family protein [Burkholderiales bacterium]
MPNLTEQYSPDRLVDRAIIHDVMMKWCRAIDRLDLDAIRAVFHADAHDDHGPYRGGVDGLIDWVRERHKTITFSMHQLSNMLIEFATPDLALVETTVCSIQRYTADGKKSLAQLSGGKLGAPGRESDLMGSSRYVDRFERRHGEWRIARRTVIAGWRRIVDVDADAPVMGSDWTVQRRDLTDFIFRERAELGLAKPSPLSR